MDMQSGKHEGGRKVPPRRGNDHAGLAPGEGDGERSMLRSIETATAGWLDQMAAMRRVEAEFATELVRARTASEALSVCSGWLAKRVDSLVAVEHRLLDLWLEGEAGRFRRGLVAAPIKPTHLKGKD